MFETKTHSTITSEIRKYNLLSGYAPCIHSAIFGASKNDIGSKSKSKLLNKILQLQDRYDNNI